MTILNMAGGGGNNINVPLNGISNLTALSGDGQAVIKRTDVGDLVVNGVTVNEWSCTKLVRKTGSAPVSSNDGTPVLTETLENAYSVTGYTNTGLTNETTYYYGAFSVGTNGLETISNIATVTPSTGWQPGVNTIVYMPIDTSDTSSIVYDHSTNGNDFNWYGTANYDTLASGKRVLSFGGSNGIYVDTNLITAQPITMNIWLKRNGTQADSTGVFTSQKLYGGNFMLDGGAFNQGDTLSFVVGSAGIFNKPYNDNTRYNVVGVLDNGEFSLYFNGQLQGTQSVTVNLSTDANSFGFTRNNGESMNYRFFNGWMADMIIEDKAWTLQEISDYYDQTKGDYGIS